MRYRLAGLSVMALLLAGATRPAAAQARGYVGFGAGVSVPLGDFADDYKLGWLGQVVAGVTGASGKIGGRIDGMYARNALKGTGGFHLGLFGANADIVFTPGKRPAKVHPYILGGVGFFNAKLGGPSGYTGGSSSTDFAWNLGAGIQIHTSSKMDFFTEARFISISSDPSSTNFLPISIGIRWGGI
ncbi:MAG TPA: outer membrane beta-barrel protein [Gemmatimonadales bacterium]|nr:outer membrane beta-barrel protein [Gemmatimonadales bacterium]